jgi:hypothetical protein
MHLLECFGKETVHGGSPGCLHSRWGRWYFSSSPLKPEARLNNIKNSVRTAKKTHHFTITKINWLTLFKEIIAVYYENHTKHMNTK